MQDISVVMKSRVDQIAECITQKIHSDKIHSSNGLYTGNSGILLFLFHYSSLKKEEIFESFVESYLDILLSRFEKELRSHSFSGGLSGILYLFNFLRVNGFVDIDIEEDESNMDKFILKEIKKNIRQQEFDFMHEALGGGLYYLQRNTHPEIISELLDYLYESADKELSNNCFKWQSLVDIKSQRKEYSVALSHGMSSIVVFLTRVLKSGRKDDRVFEMLNGAVNYILSQEIDFNEYGSHFPSHSKGASSETLTKSRLAWCYGDLGVASAIWQAGKATGNSSWQNKAFNIFIDSTQRTSTHENSVYDAGICHGSSGIALIFRRMYLETSDLRFLSAANYWIEHTLNLGGFSDGLAGYKTYAIDRWLLDYDLLQGIAGIGMVMMSFLVNDSQNWDDLFLLS